MISLPVVFLACKVFEGIVGNATNGVTITFLDYGLHLVAKRLKQAYKEQIDAIPNPGTYYLTKGWFEVGSYPLSEYEILVKKYGPETSDWLMQTQCQHYKRLVFVVRCAEDLTTYRLRALEQRRIANALRWLTKYIWVAKKFSIKLQWCLNANRFCRRNL